MGLLTEGRPLDWYETKLVLKHVKQQGLTQFLNIYNRSKDRKDDLKWGDEIEYMIVKFDHANKIVRLSLRGQDVLKKLLDEEDKDNPEKNEFLWRPEYGAYMLEGTPGQPYSGSFDNLKDVEDNMRRRRKDASKYLEADETVLSISNFPRTGCPNFTSPSFSPTPKAGIGRSLFFPDEAIYDEIPRYRTITNNTRQRRGEENVVANVPIFRDVNTQKPFVEDFKPIGDDGQALRNAKPDHIYMDAMGFGTGCSCLQVTMQASNVSEARWLYDQLTPLTPVLLALSAATPIFRGFLSDVDSRWNILSETLDDRTQEERGLKPLKDNYFVIPKTRYCTTDSYLCPCNAGYNDIPLQYDEKYLDTLKQGGVDEHLARHIAHLFIRDPLQLFEERIDQDDDPDSTEHFETIQSSIWMNMRFKPPPLDDPEIGWRIEFRPLELQLTDFENAANACFVFLFSRVIVSCGLTFIIPISKVDENMLRAQKRDALLTEKFWFRRNFERPNEAQQILSPLTGDNIDDPKNYVEMTVNEIINGKSPDFPGIISLIRKLLDSSEITADARLLIDKYLKFIELRASGTLCTLAHWMREFVTSHPSYKKDSIVSEEICYDLVKSMADITYGRLNCPSLLGDFQTKSNDTDKKIP